MTNYSGIALAEINPCGIDNKSETQCTYVSECSQLGRTEGGHICVAKMGYQIAEYLLEGSDINTEKKDMKNYLNSCINKKFVGPSKKNWNPIKITESNKESVLSKIINNAQSLEKRARDGGNLKNPLNFDNGADAILSDLF